ncbi:MAG: peptidylprolyl isomerase [Acidobacteriota bacterium]
MKNLLLLAAVATVSVWGQAADPVVLTVGTEKITQSMFEQIISTLNEQQRASLQDPEARRSLAEQIAELKIMAQEGRTRKLDVSPEVKMKIAMQADQVVANALYQDMMKAKIDDAAMMEFYNQHKQDWEEAKGRHILIRMAGSRVPVREGQKDLTTEEALAKAKELRAKIVAGADFEAIAKAESDDTGSGVNGGDLGSFSRGQMIGAFDDTAFSIPVGEISQPIQTEFGYHLIKIDERKAAKFEDVRTEIEQQIRPDMGAKAIDALKAKTNIVFSDTYFGPAPVPAPVK